MEEREEGWAQWGEEGWTGCQKVWKAPSLAEPGVQIQEVGRGVLSKGGLEGPL